MKTTKDGKVLVTIDTEFTYFGKIDDKIKGFYQKTIMMMYSKLVDKTNGELIDQYNKWFSENVFKGDMFANPEMLALYDAGLSAKMMEAAADISVAGYKFVSIDCHTATYTIISPTSGKGISMKLGDTKLA